jgi:hypothetical protein
MSDKVKILINPPPSDRRCQGCGKHTSELKPFGGAGDPLVGDFTGALLLKTFRSGYRGEPIKELDDILSEYKCEEGKDNMDELIKKYGQDKIDHAFGYGELSSQVSASWECRDCICLQDPKPATA